MVTQDARLFHIDYGFVLGCDPKFRNPTMRISKDIIDCIGGVESKGYELFRTSCTQIYNCLRKHIHLFYNMLLILSEDGLGIDNGKYTD